MTTGTGLRCLVWVGAATLAVLLMVQGSKLPDGFVHAIPAVGFVVYAAYYVFERWAWAWPRLHPWLVRLPDISGTWKGELVSNWVDRETGKPVPPIETYLVVSQTHSTIKTFMMTKEMTSPSVAAVFQRDAADALALHVLYRSEPMLLVQPRSPIHYGAMMLRAIGDPASSLEGYCWTTRDTKGSVRLQGRNRRRFSGFDEAKAAAYEGVPSVPEAVTGTANHQPEKAQPAKPANRKR